jgi:type VI secretion system protein ImpG
MKSLLPYFEDELASLRGEAGDFAETFPVVAQALRLSEHGSDDPHVDRLIQSSAWFSARVMQRLDDGYAGFAETLLDAIYPHYRRPFPSCAVAQFTPTSGASGGGPRRGSAIYAGLPGPSPLPFRAIFDVNGSEPDLTRASFHPAGRFDTTVGTSYTGPYLDLRWMERQDQSFPGFRVFIDGEPTVAAALRDAMGLGIKAVLRPDADNDRYVVDGGEVLAIGFDEEVAVLDDPVGIHPGFSLVREWLAHPETFGFFDLSWPGGGEDRGLETSDEESELCEARVILMLDAGIIGDGQDLRSITASNLLTRCGLVANLFRASTGVAGGARTESTFEVRPHHAGYAAGGLIAVESITALPSGQGTSGVEVPHFHAVGRRAASCSGPFWVFGGTNTETGAESILFVDGACQPVSLAAGAALSIRLLCCDADRVRQIVCATPMAQLYASENAAIAVGRLISRPTAVSRFRLGRQAAWRLVSHLALSQLSLLEANGSVLRALLELYLPGDSASGEQIIRAIVGIGQGPITRWLNGANGVFVRGTRIDLRVDRIQLIGVGLHALIHVLDRFFAQYAHVNSFTELTISCSHTSQEIYRCRMRTGNGPLI